jgi:hypothetical protein
MVNLITATDIKTRKGLSNNINLDKELNPHIQEAQEFDLRSWIGESFYLDILDKFQNSPTDADFVKLFDGVEYTYNGDKYEHQGIKGVLVYLAYARYVGSANAQSTPTGFVQKNNQYSDPISGSQITRMVKQNESGANTLQRRVEDFLNRNAANYPLWSTCKSGSRKKSIRINKIG